jgi:uncharacterized membrane protein
MSREQDPLPPHVNQNIESIVAFHQREQEKLTRAERVLERVSDLVVRPAYLVALLALVVLWIAFNQYARVWGFEPLDPPPFSHLQGLLTLASLATSTIVLIKAQRQGRLESQRAHLDLQVNLLTEQKVTKLIHLLEELRHDLPMVRDRHDPEAQALQQSPDMSKVLSALEDVAVVSSSAAEQKGAAPR